MSGATGCDDAGMDYPLCERCGLDPNSIQDRIRLLGLERPEMEQVGRELQKSVIAPNVGRIVDNFCGSLAGLCEFTPIVENSATVSLLRARHESYLLGLGIGFHEREYFEERLRIGAVYQRAGVPQSLYQCTFQGLQSLLIDNIPDAIRQDEAAFEALLRFILKITALDMSLAAESFCSARVSDLKQTLQSERDKSEHLHKLSVTDWLTKLHNHSYSRRCLDAALLRANTEGSSLCVIMADLDRFKSINDKYGHLVGDEVLRIAAARMVSAARAGDEIGRYGGEEFLLILEDSDTQEGLEVAERIRKNISDDAIHSGENRIRLSVSLGLTTAGEGDTVNSLIERADTALYVAKAAGRNCLRVQLPNGRQKSAS